MTRRPIPFPLKALLHAWHPYADAARFAVLAVAEAWAEREPFERRRIGHASAIATAAMLLVGGTMWRGAPELIGAAEALGEIAPAALNPSPVPMLAEHGLPAVVVVAPPPAPAANADEPRRWALLELAEQRLRALERRLDLSESERGRLENEFQRLQSDALTRRQEIAERERVMADRERQMVDLVAGQSVALGRLAEQTSASVEALAKLVARTGIDPERLIAAVRRENAVGGPYIQLAENHLVMPDAVAPGLGGAMARLEALRRALTALPLESPVADAAIMSTYGVRRDPFNGQAAMHHGLDLVATARAPVRATAAGTVVHAGWQGEFGNLVEIDHGFGIRTRYAHLSRIDVKLGDEVGARVQLGLMGSTGRSTGPHLHYEVAFEGDTLDPMRFIEAKRYALRGGRGGRGGRG
ncbi:MAG: peptidoglycan DD-metalloendopeptidase family protein [Alphaproteobacteria bacterium]|nr:peptidoglycan DD-metalloendopeptidase family protein [Alphaproteobacteria bacterium]